MLDTSKPINYAFPSDFASKSEKETKEYGLQYFNAMWSAQKVNFAAYNEQRGKYILNRKFAEGLQDINELKNFMAIDGDLSYLNLDFHPINRIATIVDNMTSMITDKIYKIKCTPGDTISKSKLDKERNRLKAEMLIEKLAPELERKSGVPMRGVEKLPESQEELELHLRMNFKMDDALAMELALRWVFDNNNLDEASIPKVVRDFIVDKKSCLYRYYDKNRNIRLEHFDHIDLVTPYSKDDRFRNITYQGFLRKYTIGQIAEMNTGFTDQELYEIAKAYQGKHNNPLWNINWATSYEGYYNSAFFAGIKPYMDFYITVMEGFFLTPITETTKLVKHKKSKSSKVKATKGDVSEDFKVISSASNKKLYRMEGKYIPDSKYIWDYGFSENLERDVIKGGYSPECELPGVIYAPNIYDMQNKSLVERMIPFEKQINLAHLKFQQFLIKATPPGIAININGLDSIMKGQGDGKMKPTDYYKMYAQTGSTIFTDWDETNNRPINIPFQELQGGISPAFTQLINVHNHYMQLINEVVGFNTSVDSSSPNPKLGLGVSQMAQQSTYNCMKPIYSATVDVLNRSAKRVALMIQDSIKLNNTAFIEAIGQSNADVLKMGAKMSFSTENIQIESAPEVEEIQALMSLISIGIQQQMLTPSDVLQIQQQMKTDITLAGQLLVLFENRNRANKQKESQALQEQNGQIQQQSAQATAQGQMQVDQVLTENKIKVIQSQAIIEDSIAEKAFMREMELQKLKNLGTATVAEIAAGGKVNVQEAANQAKVITQHIANEAGIEKEHIKNDGMLASEHIKHNSTMINNQAEHQHVMEQSKVESKNSSK